MYEGFEAGTESDGGARRASLGQVLFLVISFLDLAQECSSVFRMSEL